MADQDLLNNLDNGVTDDCTVNENKVILVEPNEIIESADNKQLTVTDSENSLPANTKKGKLFKKRQTKDNSKQSDEWDYTDFSRLAELMNIPLSDLKDEFMLFQIRKLMSRMGKVLVRFNVSDSELEKVFINSFKLQTSEILVSPAYLPICEKIVKKHKLENPEVCTIIDFPFGESSFKSKINDLKESARVGVDGITVTIPSMMTAVDNVKSFKKQVKRIGRLYKKGSGIALNATDLEEQQIKRAIKLCARTRLSQITFAFGEATLDELKTKINLINKHKGNKKIYVIANIDRAETVMELFKLKVDKILTPYADMIGEELVKRFNVKSIKLK